ncbi:hypothetical protein GCM10027612_06670 [Microbispora bryophytorum subsp. camponoti]
MRLRTRWGCTFLHPHRVASVTVPPGGGLQTELMTSARSTLTALARSTALAGLALAGLAAGLAMLAAMLLSYLVGLVIVFPRPYGSGGP